MSTSAHFENGGTDDKTTNKNDGELVSSVSTLMSETPSGSQSHLPQTDGKPPEVSCLSLSMVPQNHLNDQRLGQWGRDTCAALNILFYGATAPAPTDVASDIEEVVPTIPEGADERCRHDNVLQTPSPAASTDFRPRTVDSRDRSDLLGGYDTQSVRQSGSYDGATSVPHTSNNDVSSKRRERWRRGLGKLWKQAMGDSKPPQSVNSTLFSPSGKGAADRLSLIGASTDVEATAERETGFLLKTARENKAKARESRHSKFRSQMFSAFSRRDKTKMDAEETGSAKSGPKRTSGWRRFKKNAEESATTAKSKSKPASRLGKVWKRFHSPQSTTDAADDTGGLTTLLYGDRKASLPQEQDQDRAPSDGATSARSREAGNFTISPGTSMVNEGDESISSNFQEDKPSEATFFSRMRDGWRQRSWRSKREETSERDRLERESACLNQGGAPVVAAAAIADETVTNVRRSSYGGERSDQFGDTGGSRLPTLIRKLGRRGGFATKGITSEISKRSKAFLHRSDGDGVPSKLTKELERTYSEYPQDTNNVEELIRWEHEHPLTFGLLDAFIRKPKQLGDQVISKECDLLDLHMARLVAAEERTKIRAPKRHSKNIVELQQKQWEYLQQKARKTATVDPPSDAGSLSRYA